MKYSESAIKVTPSRPVVPIIEGLLVLLINNHAKRNERVIGDDGKFTYSLTRSLTRSQIPSLSCKLSDNALLRMLFVTRTT